jgi:hypothetical protein
VTAATQILSAAVAVISHDTPAIVRFSASIEPVAALAMESHDLGNGIVSTVATYRETGTENPRDETIEMLAYRGDSIAFDATGERLVAVRSNPRGLKSTEAYARK